MLKLKKGMLLLNKKKGGCFYKEEGMVLSNSLPFTKDMSSHHGRGSEDQGPFHVSQIFKWCQT